MQVRVPKVLNEFLLSPENVGWITAYDNFDWYVWASIELLLAGSSQKLSYCLLLLQIKTEQPDFEPLLANQPNFSYRFFVKTVLPEEYFN